MTQQSERVRRYGRVAVLMGGWSGERPVSLVTGQSILAALQRQGVDAHAVDFTPERGRSLDLLAFDRVFIALHGRGGEDGVVQGYLETLGIPYTGTGVMGSALGMDKLACKRLWAGMHLPSTPYRLLGHDFVAETVADALGLPLVVKPARGGSSLGISRVNAVEDLPAAYQRALAEPGEIFAEPWIQGREYTVGILNNEPLPVIQIETPGAFYDYQAKYELDTTRYLCPPPIAVTEQLEIQSLALSAFAAVDGNGWGRVDLLQDEHGENYLMEVNTVPGMTPHSLVPKAAAQIGIDFDELCLRILETSMHSKGRGHA